MEERSYLSIGEVLTLLREEFPDVTISKIRFLESRGLLIPERTPSGYRKFYPNDVDRLRWIMRQQREHFLPLKVIKGRLEGAEPPSLSQPLFEVARRASAEASPRDDATTANLATGSLASGGLAPGKAAPGTVSSRQEAVFAGLRAAGALKGLGDPLADRGRAAAKTPENGSLAARDLPAEGGPRHEASADAAGAGPFVRGSHPSSAETRQAQATHQESVHPALGAGAGGPGRQLPAAASAASGTELVGQVLSVGKSRGVPASDPSEAGERPEARAPAGRRRHEGAAGNGDTPPVPVPVSRTAAAETGGAPNAPDAPDAPGGALAERSGAAAPEARRSAPPSRGQPHDPVEHVSLNLGELAQASGTSEADVVALEGYGLICPRTVAGEVRYDEEALAIVKIAAELATYGIEARHLRLFRNAAERQAGLYGQVVTPVLRQRNPEARKRALESLARLADLGAALQASFTRAALREYSG